MNESEFISISNQVLEGIASAIDAAAPDVDWVFKGEGILEVEFDDGAKLVINRNTPVREIWVAAPEGGFHFRLDGTRWIDTRDSVDLGTRVSALISSAIGKRVQMSLR